MNAILIDPKERSIREVYFDGNEESIPQILGCDKVEFEQWSSVGFSGDGSPVARRIYSDTNSVGNSALHGFYIPHSAGIINHGRCLMILFDTSTRTFIGYTDDLDRMKREISIMYPDWGHTPLQQRTGSNCLQHMTGGSWANRDPQLGDM